MFFLECYECEEVYGGSNRNAVTLGWKLDFEAGTELCPDCASAKRQDDLIAAKYAERLRLVTDTPSPPPEVVGFDRPERGSQDRYKADRAVRPWAAHTLWWIVHNAVAHPLIAILPFKPFFSFHDWTSEKMHGQ